MREDYFASYVDFETATTGEYIHTYKSLIDIVNNRKIKDICWLEDYEGTDEIINCTLKDSDNNFNVIVPKFIFDYQHFKKWCEENKELIWKDERHPNNIRGINYF